MKHLIKTMAFTLLGLVLSMNLWADSYTITFKTGSGDGTSASTSTACSTIVSAGSDYLSGNLATATKVYYSGDSGLKLGTSSDAGTIKMNLSTKGQVTPTSIVVRAKRYSSSKATKIQANSKTAQDLTSDFADYTFTDFTSKITYLEIKSSKGTSGGAYCWIESVTVNYEGSTPSEPVAPSITTQPEGATYEKDATATALSVEASGNPTPTYQWYSNTTESTSGASAIANATNASYTPSTATVGTTYYYCVATNSEGSATSDIVAVTVTAALPKITITADQVTSFTNSYKEYTWTASDVSGKLFAYKQNGMQFNTSKDGYYVYNTDPIPGNIRSIKMTTHSSGTEREWKVSVGTAQITSISGDAGTEPTKNVAKAGTTWTISGNNQYFCLVDKSGASNISEIVITYEEDNTPSIEADVEAIEFEQKELDGTATDSKVISATGKNLTAPISASMKSGSDAIFSVVANGTPTAAAGEFTVSYSTDAAGEYEGTVVLSSGETSIEIPVSASVVAHIPVLQSVAVSGTPDKTEYTEGDAFETAGLVVTGTYDVGDPQPITEGIEWTVTPSGALAANVTSVSVVATVEGVASEAFNVDITVAKLPKWAKVTEDKTDWSGEYLLVYENEGTAYVWTGVDAANGNVPATITDGQIIKPATAATITVATMDGGYSILVNGGDNNGKYIYGTSGSNTINFGTTASANTLAYSDGNVTITSNTSTIMYNSDANNCRFRYYKSGSSQKAVQLYEFVSTDPVITANPTSVTFPEVELTDAMDDQDIAIEAKNLTENITVAMKDGSDDIFEVTPASLTLTEGAFEGNINIAYLAEATDEYSGIIVLTSGETSIEIPVSVNVVAHVPVLQSIYVKEGASVKKEYTVGDAFETAGLEVWGKYDEGADQQITEDIEWIVDPETFETAGTASVEVVAGVGTFTSEAYTVNNITVNAAPQIATYDFTTNLYGHTGVSSGSDNHAGDIAVNEVFTEDPTQIKFTKSGSTVTRFWSNKGTSELRIYKGAEYTISSEDYNIVKIEFAGTDNVTFNGSALSNNTWIGKQKSVSFGNGDSNSALTGITVTYAVAAPSAATPTITPSAEAETYWEPITVTLASDGADAIYYTTNGDAPTAASTLYEAPFQVSATTTIKAIAVKDGLDNSEVASKTFTFGPVFTSLEDLVAADLTSGTTVKVSFENVPIKSVFVSSGSKRQGIYFDIQKGGKDIEIYYSSEEVPDSWVAEGTVSGTMTCPWKNFNGTWELAPASGWTWSNLDYTAPAVTGLTKVEVEGTPTKTTYVDGEKFDPAGLTIYATIDDVRDVYDGSKGEVIYTIDPETLTEGTTSVSVVATIGTVSSDAYTVNDLTVNAIQQSTIADFISNKGGRCYLIGTVSGKSGNNFTLTDASGSIYVYGHTCAAGVEAVANDDYIKVTAEEYEYYDGKTHEAKNVVVVEKPEKPHVDVTGISLDKTEATITVGKTETLVATIEPLDASDKEVIWTSNNEAVATVEDGVVTGVAKGTAVITATTNDGDFTATCTVTVEELPIWATTYTSNVTLSGNKVKLAEAYQPADYPEDGYDAKKDGSSSAAASISVKVPANTTGLHYHLFAWTGEGDKTVSIKKGETVLATFTNIADEGVSGSTSTFTLKNNPVDGYGYVALEGITEETTITFSTAASKNRICLFGVNAVAPAAITIDPTSKDFGEVKQGFNAEQVFTLTPNAFATGTITAEIEGEGFSASTIEDNEVTVTFAPTEIKEYSATLIIKHDGEQMCTATLTGKGISATTPEIAVSDDEIDFGKVKQDATITPQTVTVTLNYLDAATASISENDAFTISPTSLVLGENTITISATASSMGAKNATITITGEDATTKTIAVKMDVTSKWAGEYTSNVKVESDKVIIDEVEYDAVKAGSGSSQGSTTITVPEGAYALHFHAAGWNTEDVTLAVKNGETELGSFSLYKDAGVKGSGPSYTLEGENYDTDQYFYVEFDALEEETTFTFAATSGKRFVLYGVNQEGGLTKELSAIEVSGTPNKLQYTEGAEFDPTGLTIMGTFKFGEVTLPDKEDVTDQVTEWVVDPVTLASTTTSVSVVAKVGEIASEAYIVENIRVLPENTDIINASTGTATTSTYKAFTATGLTNTQYAGKTALNDNNLTLSNAANHPGIVSTYTIGYIKSVKVTIADDNTHNLDVYGSHRAYQSAEDLYSKKNAIRGTKIGTLTASGELDLSSEDIKYEFIGIRSEEGAIQVPEIQITWTPVEFLRISVAENIEGGTIDIDRTVATAEEAGNVQVTIEPTPNEGLQFDKLVIYNESDEDVTSSITIAESGLAFTMPDYNVKVGATFKSQPVTAISLDKSAITIDKNSTETLTASFLPNGAFTEVTWTSDNEAIATVENGVVTGKGQGTTTITASCNDGALTATCTVTVNAQPEYVLVTDATSLQDGDVIVLGNAANNAVNGGYNTSKYLDKVEATITEGVLTSNDLMEITLCKTDAGWNLVTEQGHLGAPAAKNLLINDVYTDWTISISGNSATISAGETPGRFLYNVNSPRFLNYTSDISATMLLPEIYRLSNDTKKVVKLMDKNNVYAIYRVREGENVTLSVALPTGCTKGWIMDGKTYAKNATIENVTADMVLYAIQSEEVISENNKEISSKDVNQGSTITIGDGTTETNVTISSDGGQEKAQAYQIVVKKNATVTITTPSDISNLEVEVGGKVTVETTKKMTVNNFVIKSTMAGGESGQVLGVTATNFEIKGEAYYDLVLGDEGNPDKWHAFAVPFNVDAINGVYDENDNKLTNEVNYAIMDYHGDVRAEGKYGWKKFRGIMQPGVFYLMTVDGVHKTFRMKMKDGFHASSSTISVTNYTGAGTEFDAGWNGIANNQLGYSSIGVDVQVLNPTSYTFETMTASTYNFTVGTPFFYQAEENGSVVLTAPNAGENYAPRRVGAAEAKNIAVTLGNDNYTDRLYISATDEATNEYQIGRDLVKMTMTNTPAVPQIFAEAYGTKLSMVDAPMMYDEAVYALNLYAPANGEYTMSAAQVKGYEVFLTQYGSVIWNLSMSEATIELTKGNNTEYGLILKATSGHAPTDINTLNGQESVQKFLYNSNIYLRHNNNTFNVQGQLVK